MVDKAWKIKQDVKYCIRRLKGGDGKKKKKKSPVPAVPTKQPLLVL